MGERRGYRVGRDGRKESRNNEDAGEGKCPRSRVGREAKGSNYSRMAESSA